MWRQLRIQGMNTFQYQNRVIFNFQFITFKFFLAESKIKAGKFYFFTTQQGLQLLVEQLEVERVKRFIIIVSVFIQRSILTVYEIIIERDRKRFQPICHQLDWKPLAESGLSGRRRSGNQYQFHPVAVFATMKNGIGNLGYLLFLQCLSNVNQICCMAFFASEVEIACIVESHDIAPIQIFFKDVQHLFLLYNVFQHFGILAAGNTQQ